MKLFAKYNRINVVSTIIIFLLGSIAFTLLLRYVIFKQIDEDLRIEKNEILTYVQRYDRFPLLVEVHDQYTTYAIISKPFNNGDKIFDEEAYNKHTHEKELRRTIAFVININNVWYRVQVSKSLKGTDELVQTIIAITIAIILLILGVTFFINRIMLKRLWQPFYSTLQTLQQFDLNNGSNIHFIETSIDEFSYLNTTLETALAKAQADYKTLKEFTENASHELQTPLAVIRSKLDILIQNEKLSEGESQAIQSAYHSLQGLNKLNQSLLLLAKIENKQFNEVREINLKPLLQNKAVEFSELWKSRNIKIAINLSDKIIKGNAHLIEVLLNNLLSNATKHNVINGAIQILLDDTLQVVNTGRPQPLDKEQLFKRFSKQTTFTEDHGLGLSIIWQICIASGFSCTYNFIAPDKHSFTIAW
jgi:signal transduction histidine kinase